MNKSSKIAVLGVSGLVGSAIVRKLLERGYANIIGTYKSRRPNFAGIHLLQVDLTSQEQTQKFFETVKPEYVFLAAAKVGGIMANNTYKAEFIYENMAIALNVIHSAYKYGVKKLLNLGSSCIYPKHAPQPMKEQYLLTAPLEPTNEPYAIAKIAAIKLCRYYNEQYGTNFLSVMPTNLYGPFDNFNLETSHVLPALIRKFHLSKLLEEGDYEGIMSDFKKYPIGFGLNQKLDLSDYDSIMQILNHLGIKCSNSLSSFEHRKWNLEHRTLNIEPQPMNKVTVTLWGSGKVYREFLHVDDLADACLFIMKNVDAWSLSPYHPKINIEHRSFNLDPILPDYLINIGTGEDLTIDELAHIVKNIVGFKGEIYYDTSKPEGTPRKLLDITNIRKLGWSHKIGLKEGIKKVYEWYKES